MKAQWHCIFLIVCALWLQGCVDSARERPASDLSPAALANSLLSRISDFSHPVIARAGVTPSMVRAGESATLVVAVKIQPGWHVYAPGGAPRYAKPIQLEIRLPEGILLVSPWIYPPGIKKPKREELIYEDSVVFTCVLGAASGVNPGARSVICDVYYMACEEERCLPPKAQSLRVAFEIVK